MARWIRTATTEESTPPESAQSTRWLPTVSRIASTVVSMKPAMDHVRATPQMSRKLSKILLPWGVWTTSGWNWTA